MPKSTSQTTLVARHDVTPEFHFYEPLKGHGPPHDPFKAIVAPRFIGRISTQDADGGVNLAPKRSRPVVTDGRVDRGLTPQSVCSITGDEVAQAMAAESCGSGGSVEPAQTVEPAWSVRFGDGSERRYGDGTPSFTFCVSIRSRLQRLLASDVYSSGTAFVRGRRCAHGATPLDHFEQVHAADYNLWTSEHEMRLSPRMRTAKALRWHRRPVACDRFPVGSHCYSFGNFGSTLISRICRTCLCSWVEISNSH